MILARTLILCLFVFLLWIGWSQVRKQDGEPRAAAVAGEAEDGSRPGESDASDFMRFVERPDEGRAALESAITTYRDGEGRRVDLVGAVHVADRAYFELLNRIFRGYDAVLYEMVKPKDVPVEARAEGGSAVSSLQRGMKDFLDLEFQLDAVDYGAENFVHADLDPDTFFELMDEKGESILTLLLQAMLHEWQAGGGDPELQAMPMAMALAMLSEKRARNMKYLLGKQFADLERISAGLERGLKGQESVILVERNKAALRVLREQLDHGKKKLAIFYGAAHLPDLERRLRSEFGFERTGHTWLTAWDIELPAPAEDERR